MKKRYIFILSVLLIVAIFLGVLYDESYYLYQKIRYSFSEAKCCNCGAPDPEYVDEIRNYYCKNCLEIEKRCSYCFAPPDKASWRKDYNKFYCDSCYTDILTCDFCMEKKSYVPYQDNLGGFYCDECSNKIKDFNECTSCGRYFDYELFEVTEEDFECRECYGG